MKTQSQDKAPSPGNSQPRQTAARGDSAATVVFDALRKAIVEGELADGVPLRQDDLARQFNTSRIPVREAISRLEEQGLAKSQRFKGAVVAGLSAAELGEIYEFRALVEPEVMRRAVKNLTPALLDEAESFFDKMEDASDMRDWAELNRSFHATLYAPSGLTYHLDALQRAMDKVHRYLTIDFLGEEALSQSNADHRMICQACREGDADRAAELTRSHIKAASASLQSRIGRRR
ncbi:putative HTH-type transcriptional regulator YdfH [Tritonibacter multivorans]|uniref:Putative HTH-type transcriptional regulator YdfH n=1 Tax=Tritonibacter multivorans TaxID=928856 RepID=A0A0P1G1P9_9RHOB|nr:GntR family transcriptional regulator [Tritonibacter multivorans]MDA7419546.1 GntR family transcriptional regulator [Tritonibacter multivorans]CUH75679.1 putative HTH-type transcriptional regulator YdfH [Tritonibacter multivorans]SFC63001.1 transcriptional regulator, GntR family [Tritonibacter multivorans]